MHGSPKACRGDELNQQGELHRRIQQLTPGYKLVFDLAGTSYPVHTNSDGSHR